MGDIAMHISTGDLKSARDFLKECLRAEKDAPGSQVTGRLAMLVMNHTERACMWANTLCGLHGITEPEFILMGAMLHDCGKLRHDAPGGLHSDETRAHVGKKLTLKFLTEELGKDKKLAHDIALMVGSSDFGMHKNSKVDAPEKITEKIVHDANLLDYIDIWGLLLQVEYRSRKVPAGTKPNLRAILELAAQHTLRLKDGLRLDTAKLIAEVTIPPAGTENPPVKKGVFQRMRRGMTYLYGLEWKTLEDLRLAFGEFLMTEDPELEKTLQRFQGVGAKKRIYI